MKWIPTGKRRNYPVLPPHHHYHHHKDGDDDDDDDDEDEDGTNPSFCLCPYIVLLQPGFLATHSFMCHCLSADTLVVTMHSLAPVVDITQPHCASHCMSSDRSSPTSKRGICFTCSVRHRLSLCLSYYYTLMPDMPVMVMIMSSRLTSTFASCFFDSCTHYNPASW